MSLFSLVLVFDARFCTSPAVAPRVAGWGLVTGWMILGIFAVSVILGSFLEPGEQQGLSSHAQVKMLMPLGSSSPWACLPLCGTSALLSPLFLGLIILCGSEQA